MGTFVAATRLMPRTFYGKLATAILVLFCLLAVLQVGIQLFGTRLYLLESNQRLHVNLAKSLLAEELIGEGGEIRTDRLKSIFHTLMVINPSIEVYLTDTEGTLLAYSAPPGKVTLERISLDPVRAFLENSEQLPVFGDDPRHPGRKTVFSAAPVADKGGLRGYLYVVLAGERHETAFDVLSSSYMTRLSVGLVIAAAVFVLAAALVFFGLLTRRLRRLATHVETFQPATPGPGAAGGTRDEVDALDRSFRRMAERIHKQVEDIRRVDAERRELVSNISHDLRTPLSSMLGHLETLLMKEESLSAEDRRQYLRVAVSNGQRLSRLLDELFQLAKLDSPETSLHVEAFPLPELVQDVAQKLRVIAEAGGVEVELRGAAGLPFVRGDLGLLERAVENLLQNAIQHSPAGSVISIAFRRTAEGVEMQVSDRGRGIDEEDLPRIFDRFYRGRARTQPGSDGTGLGLAIVKRVAELHGGVVSAWNESGGGATFCLRLGEAHAHR